MTARESAAILLWGPPGVGKSSVALPDGTILKNLDKIVAHVCPHASDQRSYFECRGNPGCYDTELKSRGSDLGPWCTDEKLKELSTSTENLRQASPDVLRRIITQKETTQKIDSFINLLALDNGLDLAIETTGLNFNKEWPGQLLAQGFKHVDVTCVYVNSVEEVLERIKKRTQVSVSAFDELRPIYEAAYKTNMRVLLSLVRGGIIRRLRVYDNSVRDRAARLLFDSSAPDLDVSSFMEGSREYAEFLRTEMRKPGTLSGGAAVDRLRIMCAKYAPAART